MNVGGFRLAFLLLIGYIFDVLGIIYKTLSNAAADWLILFDLI